MSVISTGNEIVTDNWTCIKL